ncbi:phage tail domain-containing protein [Vagococcus fluvialis]|uniref:phage tail domain-containing protein n=1 Tax=Vagococcus fluvialis TaxID=2738 RepID=UPI0020338578|nr:phage tail domain-containing protein [Vagococcus fluvialis]MCM2138813.1 phage tail family protein [Vagococcus fluvialis]
MREIKFNNKVLKVKALRVIIQPLSSIVDSSENIYGLNQQRFTKYIKEPKKIILSFPYENKSEQEINKELSTFFFSKEEVMLINPKDETTYFMAKLQGEINVNTEGSYSVVTVELFSYDGYLHAMNRKVFNAALNSDGVLEMEVDNQGTDSTLLSFATDIKDDNGYLGVVSEKGAMEFGKIDEVDGYVDKSVTPFNLHMVPADAPKFGVNNGVINWKISTAGVPNVQQGSYTWTEETAKATNFGDKKDNCWYGPTINIPIPAHSISGLRTGNWKVLIISGFESKKDVSRIGRQEFNLSYNGQSVATMTMFDGTGRAVQTYWEFWVLGKKVKSLIVDKNFSEFYGNIEIYKEGSRIYFNIYSQYSRKTLTYSFYDERIAAMGVDKFTHWSAIFNGMKPLDMSLNHLRFTWIGTQKFVDVPNRYMDGDVLSYDGDSGKFYVNNFLKLDDIIQGSTDIKIPPGKHKVQFYYSDFNKVTPTIKGTIRERWL